MILNTLGQKVGQQPTSVLRQAGGRASIDNFVYN